jgi:lysophospholipase L1-like esterase
MKKVLLLSILINLIFLSGIVLAIVKIGSPRYLFYLAKYRGNGIVSLKKHKTSHLATLPIAAGKIIMLGNSITAECNWSELLDNPNILNRGIIADGTDDILNRLDPIIASKPSKIFLLIGVNDLAFTPPQYIIDNYEKIIGRIVQKTPETRLYLESILPIHNNLRRNGMKNEDIDTVNQGIQNIAKKYNLTYIDINAKFKNTEGGDLKEQYSLDGIHLNGEGYLLFKDIIKPYLATD